LIADGWDEVITETDDAVHAWVSAAVGDATKVSALPPSGEPPDVVEVRSYLYALAPAPPARERTPPFQFLARYIVIGWGKNPAEEHRVLGLLLGSALAERGDEIDLVPPSHELWRAFGVPPRPSFCLQIPVRVQRPTKEQPLVLEAPVLRPVPAGTLTGRVLGQNDIPLAGVIVKHDALNVTARTDRRGLFRFGMVPAGDDDQTITVYAKGKQVRVAMRPNEGQTEPIVIRFATKEA
jgi:hypothetical protein